MKTILFLAKEEGPIKPVGSIFTWLYNLIKDTEFAKIFGFDVETRHLGMIWFECLVFSILIVIALTILVLLVTRKLSKGKPSKIQLLFETVYNFIKSFTVAFAGEHGKKYAPYIGTLFIYIFLMNIFGLIPLLRAPTMTASTTFALGITTFFVVQIVGIKENGLIGYLKHFAGNIVFIAPIMLVIHVLGELAKPLSLSLRLYGNISAKDTLLEVVYSLCGWFAWAPAILILILGLLVAFIQAVIFSALTCVYFSLYFPHDEKH
jgi:F-type H+-transporting ATPase subunit a